MIHEEAEDSTWMSTVCKYAGMAFLAVSTLAVAMLFFVVIVFAALLHKDPDPAGDLLVVGQEVVTVEAFRAPLAEEVIHKVQQFDEPAHYDFDSDYEARGKLDVINGTLGIVKIDTKLDDDDTSPMRAVSVTLTDGQHKGTTVAIPRGHLRCK